MTHSKRHHGQNVRNRNAFTLIELLVVIAIISLLVSILVPSLTKAKELAKSLVCATNLKGLMLAQVQYDTDIGELSQYNWGQNVPWYYRLRRNSYLEEYRQDEYKWHATGCDMLLCPNFPNANYTWRASGYTCNYQDYDSRNEGDGWRKLDDFKNPSSKILLGSGTWHLVYRSGDSGYWRWDKDAADYHSVLDTYKLAPRHLLGGNFGFLDGHVEYYSMEDRHEYYEEPEAWIWNQ